MLLQCFRVYFSCIRGALSTHAFSLSVFAQPKWVITHFDLWNQTLNQHGVRTPLSQSYRHYNIFSWEAEALIY